MPTYTVTATFTLPTKWSANKIKRFLKHMAPALDEYLMDDPNYDGESPEINISMEQDIVWNLDDRKPSLAIKYVSSKGFDLNTHPKFKVGDTIEFFTGTNDDIRARSTIKGLDGDDIYVYNDCYWFPIQDDNRRKITIIKE